MVRFLEMVGLATIQRHNNTMISCNNLTLINLILLKLGPMHEDRVAICLVLVQTTASVIAFGIRYGLVQYIN